MGNTVGAYVALRDGMIWTWKAGLGRTFTPERVAFERGTGGCEVHTGTFPDFDAATEWMRQWSVHPDAPGFHPHENVGDVARG